MVVHVKRHIRLLPKTETLKKEILVSDSGVKSVVVVASDKSYKIITVYFFER